MAMSMVLITVAAFFDALSLIPFVGTIMGPIFWVIVGVYLWTKGMGIFNGKKLAATLVSFAIELFPGIQALPGLIAGIVAILIIIRIEDKTGKSVLGPINKGLKPSRFERKPLNSSPGIRYPTSRGNIRPQNLSRKNSVDEEISLAE